MKCADIMTTNPMMCLPDDKLHVAVNLMWDYDCGATPVVDSLEIPKLVGMVTDRDIAMHIFKYACVSHSEAKVSDCMSSQVITCCMEDPVSVAMDIMAENKIRRIPIVDENDNCIGIISQTDIIKHADDIGKEAVIRMLQMISSCKNTDEEVSLELAKSTAESD